MNLYVYDTAQKVKEVKKFYQKQGNYMEVMPFMDIKLKYRKENAS